MAFEGAADGFAIELLVPDFIVIDCVSSSTGDWRLRVEQGLAFFPFDPYPALPLSVFAYGIRRSRHDNPLRLTSRGQTNATIRNYTTLRMDQDSRSTRGALVQMTAAMYPYPTSPERPQQRGRTLP